MSWIAALQAFAARSTGAATSHTLGAKCALYDRLARIHLRDVAHSPDGLAVLRQARWELLRSGSAHSRARLLEHILASFAAAAAALPNGSGTAAASHTSGDTRTTTSVVSEAILLEQLQCLVEAKVSGITPSARHLRHLLHHPHLSAISPSLPQLLLQEITASPAHTGKAAASAESGVGDDTNDDGAVRSGDEEEDEARVECAVALARGGHAALAMRLCTAASFLRVVRAVAAQDEEEAVGKVEEKEGEQAGAGPRAGWQLAWALVEAAPRGALLADTAAGAAWRAGLIAAVRGRFRASGYKSPAMKDWLVEFMRQYKAAATTTSTITTRDTAATTREGATSTATSDRARRVPREVMEAYVTVCPVGAWQAALEAVLRYNAEADHDNHNGDGNASRVPMGLVLTLLQLAQQPKTILRLFYGAADRAADAEPRLPVVHDGDQPSVIVERLFCLPQHHHQHQQEEQTHNTAEDGHTCDVFSTQDRQHPALYNHIMTALAAVGQWQLALHMYRAMTAPLAAEERAMVVRANAYTHLCAARILLRGVGSEAVPRETDTPYELAVHAMGELAGLPPRSPLAHKVAHEMDGLREALALWAATRGNELRRVLRLARTAPLSCRYIRLIALAATLRERDVTTLQPPGSKTEEENDSEAVVTRVHAKDDDKEEEEEEEEFVTTVRELCGTICHSPRRSLQQVCLTLAFMANSAAAMRACAAPRQAEAARHEAVCLVPEVHRGVCEALGGFAAHSQPAFDHAVELLVHDFCLVQRAQRAAAGSPRVVPSLQPERLLTNTVQLMSGTLPYADCWRVLLQVLKDVAAEQRLSVAHAAPLLLARGVPASVAINFLPQ